MLQEKFKNHIVVLASQSPRRQALLKEINLDFIIRTKPDIDEVFPADLQNTLVAPYLSKLKFNEYKKDLKHNEFLITADTTVCIQNEIINKPKDKADAIAMLGKLSDNMHTVVTGVTMGTLEKNITFISETNVYFRKLEDAEILFYIDTYKPFDKAGAYGIQEWIGYVAITKINGSYFNVMGLPVQKLYDELLHFELK